jgi:hypothetical protein
LTNANGDFLIQGLGAGDYKIEIEATEYVEYESEPVNVKVGEVTVMKTIELLVPVS